MNESGNQDEKVGIPERSNEDHHPNISRIAFRAPPFWSKNPALYFAQVESQFITAGITTDETKFNTIVASIETEVLSHVSDLIIKPPATGKYNALKNRLIAEYADSEQKKLRMLLQELQLGDQKPSHLLRRMREVAGEKFDDELLKSLWAQRLPTPIQQILASSKGDLQAMADMADKIQEVTDGHHSNLAAVSKLPNQNSEIAELKNQVAKLTQMVEKLSTSTPRSRSPYRRYGNAPRSSSRTRRKYDPQLKVCWYHQIFQDRARRCNEPCDYVPEN